MASVSTVRTAIKTVLAAGFTSVNVYDKTPDMLVLPAFVVVPHPGDFIAFDATMGRGSDDMYFLVKALVETSDTPSATDRLDSYIDTSGSGSVKAVLDGNLGGACDFAVVRRASSYGDVEHGGQVYFGAEFLLEVKVRP